MFWSENASRVRIAAQQSYSMPETLTKAETNWEISQNRGLLILSSWSPINEHLNWGFVHTFGEGLLDKTFVLLSLYVGGGPVLHSGRRLDPFLSRFCPHSTLSKARPAGPRQPGARPGATQSHKQGGNVMKLFPSTRLG